MTPAEIDRVFGRGRLRMTTGEHVEVFREEAREGEERRYTKRFLETANGDFRPWTEREWRILDRLGARGDAAVARVVRFFPADDSGMARLQTRDAGPTVDQWAALVPLRRTAPVLPYVFGDCANWWALARQCLIALDPLHALGFVHLDFKPDNICIPAKPAQAARPAAGQPLAPDFEALALIDVAFSLLPGVQLPDAVPVAREPGYEYQSPRLVQALEEGRRGNLVPTLELDWRCDMFSLAAMLWRYLPELDDAAGTGWTTPRHASATSFVRQLLEIHAEPASAARPHRALIGQAALQLADPQLAAALQAGSSFDPDRAWPNGAEASPLTRVVPMPATRPAARARREPTFATPGAASVATPTTAPFARPMTAAVDVDVDLPVDEAVDVRIDVPAGAPVDLRVDLPIDAPVAASMAAVSAAPPATRTETPQPPPSASSGPSALASAVAGSAAALAAPSPARRAASIDAAAVAAPAPSGSQNAAPTQTQPVTARAPATAPTPTTTAPPSFTVPMQPSTAATSSRTAAPPSPARVDLPPDEDARLREPAFASEAPPRPAPTPVPILAAAGAGALIIVVAAWWGLDGRAMFERRAQRIAAPATSGVTSALETAAPAALESPALPGASAAVPTVVVGPAASPAAEATPPQETPAASAATPAGGRAAASGSDANEPRADAGPALAPAIVIAPALASEFETAATDWMRARLPTIAKSAERQLAPVLAAAGRSAELRRRGEVRAAMQSAHAAGAAPDTTAHEREARSLNEAALVAYWRDTSIPDAVRLQTQALGANPLDAEVVGNLALLRLKEKPPQAEAARQLALHALTLKDDRFPTGRIEDWTTLAIADALTGRDRDARNAWFVSMALASDLQHQCNAAVRAQAAYGDPLRPSVQAMLQRARSSAAYGRCEAAQSGPTGKPARKNVKSKSTQKARRPIP
jgi:hypothetical protein